jgi:hypothetical protein
MRLRTALVVGLVACLVGVPAPVSARFLEDWPYEKLFKEADLIVVASAGKTEATDDAPPEHHWNFEFVGQNTTFTIAHATKGKAEGKTIKVLHFKFGELKKGVDPNSFASRIVRDGPLFVAFPEKEMERKEYLLFLKKRKDGRYEFLSGPVDPSLSVRELGQVRDK